VGGVRVRGGGGGPPTLVFVFFFFFGVLFFFGGGGGRRGRGAERLEHAARLQGALLRATLTHHATALAVIGDLQGHAGRVRGVGPGPPPRLVEGRVDRRLCAAASVFLMRVSNERT